MDLRALSINSTSHELTSYDSNIFRDKFTLRHINQVVLIRNNGQVLRQWLTFSACALHDIVVQRTKRSKANWSVKGRPRVSGSAIAQQVLSIVCAAGPNSRKPCAKSSIRVPKIVVLKPNCLAHWLCKMLLSWRLTNLKFVALVNKHLRRVRRSNAAVDRLLTSLIDLDLDFMFGWSI
jgi:hypothetical protein